MPVALRPALRFVLLALTIGCGATLRAAFELTAELPAAFANAKIEVSRESLEARSVSTVATGTLAAGRVRLTIAAEPGLYQVRVGEAQVSFVAGEGQTLRVVVGEGDKLRVTGGADQELFEAYEKFRRESLARLVMPARTAANAALAKGDVTEAEPHTAGEVAGAQAHRHELNDFTLSRLRGSPALYAASSRWDGDYRLEELAAAVREFSARAPSLEISRAMEARIALLRATAIGAIAPALAGSAPDGSPLTLASFRGRHVLVDFWASWCSPCRTENRHYGELRRRWGAAGFEILGVAMDDNVAVWKAATAKDRVTWPQLSDLRGWKSPFAASYGVTALPASFLLDPEGRIIAKDVRGQALDALLAARLGGAVKR